MLSSTFVCVPKYGDAVVGLRNVAMVELAQRLGFGASFTGSGGALVCARRFTGAGGGPWAALTAAEEADAAQAFRAQGFEFARVELAVRDSVR